MPVPHAHAYFLMPLPVSVLMPVPHARAYFLMPLSVSRMGCLNAAIYFRLRTKGVLPAPASQSFITPPSIKRLPLINAPSLEGCLLEIKRFLRKREPTDEFLGF